MQQENLQTQGRNIRMQKKKEKIPSIKKVSFMKFMFSSSTQKESLQKLPKPAK